MPTSHASTSCSTPPDIVELINSEEKRYIRKGYGLISASIMVISFFYFTPIIARMFYPLLIEKFGKSPLIVPVGVIIEHILLIVILNLSMWVIYHLELPFFEKYKINSNPWPWNADPAKWREQLKKSIKCVAINGLVVGPPLIIMDVLLAGTSVRLDSESIPDSLEIFMQIGFFMFVEDFVFYIGHRIMHTKRIYGIFHKKHHEYKTTIGLAAEYSHPVDYALTSLFPTSIGYKLLGGRVHAITVWLWVLVRVGETLDGHSGYEFSWSPYRLLPFSGSASYHDFHHSNNVGNYASFFSIWDTMFGTNTTYFNFLKRKEKLSQERKELSNHVKESDDAVKRDLGDKLESLKKIE